MPASDAAVTAATLALGQVTPGAAELLRPVRPPATQLRDLVGLFAAPITGHELAELGSARWAAARAELTARTDSCATGGRTGARGPRADVLGVDLGPVRQDLRIAEHSFFLGRKGRLLTAAAPVLVHLRPGREIAPKELPALVEALASLTEQHRAVLTGWQALPGLGWLPSEANLLSDEGTAQLSAATAGVDELVAALGRLDPRVSAQTIAVRQRRARAARPRPLGRSPMHWRALEAVFTATRSRAARPGGVRGERVCWRRGETGIPGARCRQPARWRHSDDGCGRRRPSSHWPPTCRRRAGSCSAVRSSGADAVAALERGMAEAALIERWDAGGFRAFDAAGQDRSVAAFSGRPTPCEPASVHGAPGDADRRPALRHRRGVRQGRRPGTGGRDAAAAV